MKAVIASAEKTQSTSFRADMTAVASMTATGPASARLQGVLGQTVTFNVAMAAESRQRLQLRVTGTVGGKPLNVVAVLYDGTSYLSTDGGGTFRTPATSGTFPAEYSADNALAYLQAVGSATDEGPGNADGVAVERYAARLDGSKIMALMQSAAASLPAGAQKLFKNMSISGDTLDVTIDGQGHLVTLNGPIAVGVDLGGVQAGESLSQLTIHQTIDAHFHDYGAGITVTKPTVAAPA